MPKVKGYYTLAEWKALPPYRQGFILYMEADQDGSELKGQVNPYKDGTPEDKEFKTGEARATQLAQDSEE